MDSVLRIESELRRTFPADRQSCFEERLGVNVRTPCREFSLAYQDRLRGQVERRMQQSIRAVGSAWYTAWVDAGQPDLSRLGRTPADAAEMRVARELESFYQKGQAKGRTHEQ